MVIDDNVDNLFKEGVVFCNLERYTMGIYLFDKILEINPKNDAVLVAKGTAYDKLGNVQIASQCYMKAIEYNPSNNDAWYNLGEMNHKVGKYEEAIICYDNALKIKGTDTDSLFGRGLANLRIGAREYPNQGYKEVFFTNATRDFEQRIKNITGYDPDTCFYLAFSYLFLNKQQEALQNIVRLSKAKDARIIILESAIKRSGDDINKLRLGLLQTVMF